MHIPLSHFRISYLLQHLLSCTPLVPSFLSNLTYTCLVLPYFLPLRYISLKNLFSTLLLSSPHPYCMPHVPSSSSGLSTAASNILSKVQPESANVIGSTIYFLLPTLLTVDMHWSLSGTRVSWYKHGYIATYVVPHT